jgi:peptidoglycan DL-endopeptidase CwlO
VVSPKVLAGFILLNGAAATLTIDFLYPHLGDQLPKIPSSELVSGMGAEISLTPEPTAVTYPHETSPKTDVVSVTPSEVVSPTRTQIHPSAPTETPTPVRLSSGRVKPSAQLNTVTQKPPQAAHTSAKPAPATTVPNPKPAPAPVPTPAPQGSVRNRIYQVAQSFLGKQIPYVYGGKSLSALDCSGFVWLVLKQINPDTPYRASVTLQAQASPINEEDAVPGDLVFWPGHVAIYAGNGKVITQGGPGPGPILSPVWPGYTFGRVDV